MWKLEIESRREVARVWEELEERDVNKMINRYRVQLDRRSDTSCLGH
jgi:hypothetical protein